MNKPNIIKKHKLDTDRFEQFWHPVNENGHRTFLKTVWPPETYVGPGAYNSGHIEFILRNSRNDVWAVLGTDDPKYMCRKKLNKDWVKFMP